jgi:hypothetical protein
MDEITSNKAAVPGSPQPFDRRWAALAVIAVAQLMTALDATIVNIALPSAQHSLGFRPPAPATGHIGFAALHPGGCHRRDGHPASH